MEWVQEFGELCNHHIVGIAECAIHIETNGLDAGNLEKGHGGPMVRDDG